MVKEAVVSHLDRNWGRWQKEINFQELAKKVGGGEGDIRKSIRQESEKEAGGRS